MSSLALLGGEKTITMDYEKVGNLPIVSEESKKAVLALLDRDEISSSPIVKEFEKKFAKFVGAQYAVAMNNGTATLHSALFAVGVRPGDEVIVPSYTFWASVVPITSNGATPVFCDIDRETFNMDPKDIEKRITKKTKAIMVIHVWGCPCDMDAIMALAKKYNLKVVEDCSHSHGATYHGKRVGVIGDVGCFSMQGSKMLTAGEGGILVTNNREYFERAEAYGHYERLGGLPDDSNYKKYHATGMGYKYRVHPLGIAIANTELDRLEQRNKIRNDNGKLLEEKIADIDCLAPQKLCPDSERLYAYHYMYYNPDKLGGVAPYTLLKAMSAEGMMCGECGYGTMHKAPLFLEGGPFGLCGKTDPALSLPVTEELNQRTIMVAPRFETHCPELIEQYAQAIRKITSSIDELLRFQDSSDYRPDAQQVSSRSVNLVK